MATFSCPKCKKVLKTVGPAPVGKRIKCPACAAVFEVTGEDEATTGIKAEAPPMKKQRAERQPPPEDEDEEELKRKRRRRARADEEEERETDRVDDDEQEEEDRPRRSKKSKKKGVGLGLVLGSVGGVLVLVLVGVGGFVWPGFFLGGGGRDTELVAFLPANPDVVGGVDAKALRARPGFMQQIEELAKQQGNLNSAQLDLIKSADKAIFGSNSTSNQMVLAFDSPTPLEEEKVRQAFGAGAAQVVEGKKLFPKPGAANEWLAIPNNKTVVVASMEQTALVQHLQNPQGKLPPTLQESVGRVSQSHYWMAVNLQAFQNQMQRFRAPPGQGIPGLDDNLFAALQRAQNLTLAINVPPGQGLKVQVALTCSNDQDAQSVETGANTLKGMLPLLGLGISDATLKTALAEVNQSLKFERQNARVTGTLELSENTVAALEKMQAAQLPFLAGGGSGGGDPTLLNNMKQINIALHAYHDMYKRLPPPAIGADLANPKPNLSWRVAILPFLGEADLYKQFKLDEPWNGPTNKKLLSRIPRVFQPTGKQPKGMVGGTYIQYVTGPNTLFDTPNANVRLVTIPDGTSNTISIVEAGTIVPWTKPEDVVLPPAGPLPRLGAHDPNGFVAGMCDGTVRFVDRRRISEATIRLALNPRDGMPLPPDWK